MPIRMEILRSLPQPRWLLSLFQTPRNVVILELQDVLSQLPRTAYVVHEFPAPPCETWTCCWRAWLCRRKKSFMGKISRQFTENAATHGHLWPWRRDTTTLLWRLFIYKINP